MSMQPSVRRHRRRARTGRQPAFIGFVAASDFDDALAHGVIVGEWFDHVQACQMAADVAAQAGCTIMVTALPLHEWVEFCVVEGVAADDTNELAFWLAEIAPRDVFAEVPDGNVFDVALADMLESGARQAIVEHVVEMLDAEDPDWDSEELPEGSHDVWERISPMFEAVNESLAPVVVSFAREVAELFDTVTEGRVVQLDVHVAAEHPAVVLSGADALGAVSADVHRVARVRFRTWVAIIDGELFRYGSPGALFDAVLWALVVGGSASVSSRTFVAADPDADVDVVELGSWVFEPGRVAKF